MTMDPIIYEKKGAGAYRIEIHPDVVYVWYGKNENSLRGRQFKDVDHAYDHYFDVPGEDISAENICDVLFKHLPEEVIVPKDPFLPGTFPAHAFSAWLDEMKAKGLIDSNIQAAGLLGLTDDSICAYRLRGVPAKRAKTIALACRALIDDLEPWK